MIVTLGILSMFQLVFLPGLLIAQLIKLRGVGNTILISIALSPVINFLFVYAATALGIYNQQITLVFLGIELTLLIYLIYPILNNPIGQRLNSQGLVEFFKEYLNVNHKTGALGLLVKIFLVVAFLAAVYSILNYLSLYARPKMEVFTAWDAVVSWDRWAMYWYHNSFPVMTWHYPQLIPANWSLTYQFMGDARIKLFAKDFMNWIEIYILLVIFILGVIKRQGGYFWGVVIVSGFQLVLGSRGNGYVDSSVAFFALSSIGCLLIAEGESDQNQSVYIYLGAVFAAGAALTKQAGLWLVLVYPILLFCTTAKKNRQNMSRYLLGIFLIYAVTIFSWYGYKQYQIQTGKETSEIVDLISIAKQDKSWVQQLVSSFGLLQAKFTFPAISGTAVLTLLAFLLLFACRVKFYRVLLGLLIIPYYLIWALFVSYDTRNFNLVVPLIGLMVGIGLQEMFVMITNPKFWLSLKLFWISFLSTMRTVLAVFVIPIKSIKVIYLIIPLLGIFLLPLKYTDSYLLNKSIARQKEIGDTILNQKIYQYQSEQGFDGKILTDYQYLGFLPGLERYYQFEHTVVPDAFISALNRPEIGYALVNSGWMSPEVALYIKQLVADEKIKVIFEYDTYLFVTTCRGPCGE